MRYLSIGIRVIHTKIQTLMKISIRLCSDLYTRKRRYSMFEEERQNRFVHSISYLFNDAVCYNVVFLLLQPFMKTRLAYTNLGATDCLCMVKDQLLEAVPKPENKERIAYLRTIRKY